MWVGLQCAVLRSVNRLLHESQEGTILTALEDCCFTTWPLLSLHKDYHIHECKLQSSNVAMVMSSQFMILIVEIVTIATGRVFYRIISLLFKCY